MNEARVYADGFERSFAEVKDLLEFLAERGRNAKWIRKPTNTLRLAPLEKEAQNLDAADASMEEILEDTEKNTQLVLKMRGESYPVRDCAIRTILSRAGVNGDGLRKLDKATYAKVVNYCLRVAKGDALIKIADGKVSAVHGGDKHDYCILDMKAMFETTCEYLNLNFKGSVYMEGSGIYDHSIVSAMEDSFQVDWLSRTFNTIKLDKEISYSISAFYEESFPEWENQYVSIKGIDESYFYPLPKIEGRTFSKKELQEGKDVCLMNKQYARMHACEIGDMIQIRDKRLKVIGLIDNSVYSGMIIPYQTMLNVYKEEKDIQFSGTFFCENELQKQKRIDEVIEQIKEKDNHADILGVTEGEELYKNALYTKIQWRIVRGMCALVAILFFMINETIVLMAKAKKERKIMGINLALGATERDIKYCLFFETLLVTLLAVFLVMITLRPLAKLASLEHIIILDSMVIVETVILAVWACEILTWIIVSRIKKENIADMVRTTRDI